ncbi:MAG TPA: hypothetical protein VKX45_24195 [Bryobacteraceae bacterium]|nr:hypothetical protein [Bryobacteraceae bacterium]
MIYTCYEMIRDCREDRAEGWRYFITHYVPVIRRLAAHYAKEDHGLPERVLQAIRQPQSSLFASLEPAPERWFVAELRQMLVAQIDIPTPPVAIGLEELAALQPLTLLEKQAVWMETMGYGPAETGAMLRSSPATVEKVRARAAELLRAATPAWRSTILADNGLALGRQAAAGRGADCLSAKVFLEVIEGRATWRGREDLERHTGSCWHCIDHFCRMAETVEVLRGLRPLAGGEAAPFQRLLGVEEKRKGWKAIFGG